MEIIVVVVCFFKQKTAYEMRISDWSSDVCSSDLAGDQHQPDRRWPGGGRGVAGAGHVRPSWSRAGGPAGRIDLSADRGALGSPGDRKSVVLGKSVSVRVDLGCRRMIIKNSHVTLNYSTVPTTQRNYLQILS